MSRLHDILPQQILDRALVAALEQGGDFAEVFAQDSTQTSLTLQSNAIHSSEFRSALGAGVRVLAGEQTGYAYTDAITPESLIAAARTAGKIAAGVYSAETKSVSQAPSMSGLYELVTFEDTEAADKAKFLQRANDAARSFDGRVVEVVGAYSDTLKRVLIANSEGLLVSDTQPMIQLTVTVAASEDGRVHEGFYGVGARQGIGVFNDNQPEDLGREAARQATLQLSACDAPAGSMPVVIANGWGGVMLHEAVGHGLEADFNRKGTSLYSGRIGESVAAPLCTVVDEGVIPHRRGSLHVDDEGTPCGRTVLIEAGRLVGYLTDRLNAKLLGAPLTGNGRRQNYQFAPIPRMTNTYMVAGESDPEEILRSVGRGLYVKFLRGGQVDITNGNFVFDVSEAYRIESGRLSYPVRGATLIGNGPDILTKIAMVGNDLALDNGIGNCGKEGQWVPVGVGMPTVLVSEMTVGGTAIA